MATRFGLPVALEIPLPVEDDMSDDEFDVDPDDLTLTVTMSQGVKHQMMIRHTCQTSSTLLVRHD